ncbi:MAG TPA: glutathione S-transferase family protein [Candidatus Polarisedimenticolia bacterium]|jgi:glutathione S-transferase|nr:glutathione S-transferase family protein [Candidatus Polarisedimenticolia bacterium]
MAGDPVLYIGEKNISSWSMRAWLGMQVKGLRFEERTIELRRDQDRRRRRAVSPTGRVPVLHHGDRIVPDSLAILEYLEETFPPPLHPPLWPSASQPRAHARWLAASMHAGFAKLREGMSFNHCFLPEPPAPPPEAREEAAEMLRFFEDALERKNAPGEFLFGGFGGVDAMFAPAVVRLVSFGVPTAATPRAESYLSAVLGHAPVERWLKEARALPPRETY